MFGQSKCKKKYKTFALFPKALKEKCKLCFVFYTVVAPMSWIFRHYIEFEVLCHGRSNI